MSRIDETLDGCVQPLRRDPEIALDVRRELAGHLEEHLDAGMSEEEALHRFGDPGEIGTGLFQANFKRLKLRAKVRLAVMILAVPAAIGALFFSINFRFWAGVEQFLDFFDGQEHSSLMQGVHSFASIFSRGGQRLSPEEAILVYGDRSRGATASLSAEANAQYAIMELDPGSRVFRAHAILALLADDSADKRPFQIAEVEKARAFEPENALYDFLLAALFLKDALEFPVTDEEPFQIRDRALLDRAMALFRTGLAKPYCRTYIREMAEKRNAVIHRRITDFASAIERLNCYIHQLPWTSFVSSCQTLGQALPFYGEQLNAEGRRSDGEFFLDAWKPFTRRILEDENTVYAYFAVSTILRNQRDCARAPIPTTREQELNRACAPGERYIKQIRAGRKAQKTGWLGAGFLTSFFLLPTDWTTPLPEMLTSGRRLDYVFANGVMLQLLNMLGCFILCWYAIGMLWALLRGRPGFLLTFSRRDVIRITAWGVLVPVALFFVLMELTPLGGRSYGLNSLNPGGFLRLALEAFFFIFLLPLPFLILWRRACRRRGRELGFRKPPVAVWHCNMFVGWVVLLVSFTALIRPGLAFAERYWSDREQLIIHTEFSIWTDEQLARKFRAEVLDALPK